MLSLAVRTGRPAKKETKPDDEKGEHFPIFEHTDEFFIARWI